MKIPHPALMSLYGTADVFFKKASAEPRLADVIFEKLALPMATGMKPLSLKAPAPPMRASAFPAAPGTGGTMLHGGANFLPAPRPAQVGVALSKPSTPGARGVDSAVLKGEQQRFEGKLGVKPPTTAPSPGAAPPTARVQTQMQTPTQGALGPPSAKPGAPDPFAAHDAANKAKMLSPASAPGGSGWAPPSSTTKPSAAAPAPAAPEPGTPAAKGGTPWNKILAVGGALGAGALGLKGVGMGLNFLGSRGASPPADYGYAPGGYQVPMGVNGYGAPQPGSRMM